MPLHRAKLRIIQRRVNSVEEGQRESGLTAETTPLTYRKLGVLALR